MQTKRSDPKQPTIHEFLVTLYEEGPGRAVDDAKHHFTVLATDRDDAIRRSRVELDKRHPQHGKVWAWATRPRYHVETVER